MARIRIHWSGEKQKRLNANNNNNNNNNNNAILKGDVSCDVLQYLIFVSLEILLNTILKQL